MVALSQSPTAQPPGLEAPHSRFSKRLRTHGGLVIGVVYLTGLMLLSLILPVFVDPPGPDADAVLEPPSALHWLGTDNLGFDVLMRTLFAAKLDLGLALAGTAFAVLAGVPIGLVASNGGIAEKIIMRGIDMFQSFSALVLALAIVSLAGNDMRYVVFVIALTSVPSIIRVVRGEALTIKNMRYIEAARATGASPIRILRKHILPNTVNIILTQASLTASVAIMIIAGLSFLGIGIAPPAASWGAMVQLGVLDMSRDVYWTWLVPGIAILLAVMAFNAVADGIRKIGGGFDGR